MIIEMTLENEVSFENIRSIGNTVLQIASTVANLYEDGKTVLLVPSRGAIPFLKAFIFACEILSSRCNNLLQHLYAPDLFKVGDFLKNKGDFKIIPIPWTADLSVKEEIIHKYGKKGLEQFVDEWRYFFTKFVGSLTLEREERNQNPYFLLHYFVNDKIERRGGEFSFYQALPPIKLEECIMIDTVISGRALSTILKYCYKEFGRVPYTIAVVDKDGTKIKKEPMETFRRFHKWIKMYPIPRIVSEDRGASMLEVVSVVYPIFALEVEKQARLFPSAAGTWHELSRLKNDKRVKMYAEAYEHFMNMIKNAIVYEAPIISLTEKKRARIDFEKERKEFLNLVNKYKLLRPEESLNGKIFVPYYQTSRIYESGAHVIHIEFPSRINEKLVNMFKSYMVNL
jgi:hypothetical protein